MKFEIKKSQDDKFFFVLKAANGEVVATSETYESKQACKKGISAVKWAAMLATVTDLS